MIVVYLHSANLTFIDSDELLSYLFEAELSCTEPFYQSCSQNCDFDGIAYSIGNHDVQLCLIVTSHLLTCILFLQVIFKLLLKWHGSRLI